jgi:hypothetical protein
MKSTNDRAAIMRRTHGLEMKVHEGRESDFLYIKVLIEEGARDLHANFEEL